MTNPQAPPSLAGYGPPRTDFAGFGDMAQGSLAIVSQLVFGAPGSAWLRDGDWREIPALVDEDWSPRKNVPYRTLVYTGSQYWFRVASGGGPGAWRLVEPASFPEQPGPTVTAADEKPGTFYTDLRDDSSWWRYDDGEWVDASGSAGATTAADVSADPTGLDNTDATDVQGVITDFDAAISAAGGGGSTPGAVNSPLDIDGCVLWLDASDADTINAGSPSDGDPIILWADKSGNGNDFTGPIPQVELVDITGATSGQFELSDPLTADPTAALAWDIPAATMQTRLRADCPSMTGCTVTKAGQVYTVTTPNVDLGTSVLVGTQDTLDVEPSMTLVHKSADSPIYKTGILNGMGVMRVSSGGSPTTQALECAALDVLRDKPGATVFCVIDRAFINSYGPLWVSQGAGQTNARFGFNSAQVWAGFTDDGNVNEVGPQAFQPNSFFCPYVGVAGGGLAIAYSTLTPPDGSIESFGLRTPDTDSTLVWVGCDPNNDADGDCSEIILYDRALDLIERQRVLAYLAGRWGIL